MHFHDADGNHVVRKDIDQMGPEFALVRRSLADECGEELFCLRGRFMHDDGRLQDARMGLPGRFNLS